MTATSSRSLEALAWSIVEDGIGAHVDEIRALAPLAHARRVPTVLLEIALDPKEADVVRARAFGTLAAALCADTADGAAGVLVPAA